jgi:glycogen operon protein
MLAAGVPMILMGDEMRRTQRGNNNAWCQDNETSWLDWSLRKVHADVHRFLRRLIRLRSSIHPDPRRSGTLTQFLRRARIEWHGVKLGEPDWGDQSRSIAVTFQEPDGPAVAHVMVNAWNEPLEFELPPVEQGWHLMVDTFLPSPADIRTWEEAAVLETGSYLVNGHSFVFLAALAPERVEPGQA